MQGMQEMWLQFLNWEDPLEEDTATHFSILAWRNPWTEEPGGLQSIGSQRVGLDWSDLACLHAWSSGRASVPGLSNPSMKRAMNSHTAWGGVEPPEHWLWGLMHCKGLALCTFSPLAAGKCATTYTLVCSQGFWILHWPFPGWHLPAF